MKIKLSIFCVLLLGACKTNSTPQSHARSETAIQAAASPEPQIGYETGPWWDDHFEVLTLAANHIVVTHRESAPAAQLIAAQTNPRTKEEAKQKAWLLYLELKDNPQRFGDVARRSSEEPITAAMGGALGTFNFNLVPMQFVDALGNTKVGEVARPVETEQGFHILQRVQPPASVELALAHIVIKADESSGWRRMDRPVPARTTQDARTLAERLAREATADPAQFARLAMEHSDADDGQRGGRMGRISTYEIEDFDQPLFNVGSQLTVGSVSTVVELATGAHVLMRLPDGDRTPRALSLLVVGYADSQLAAAGDTAPRSKVEARTLAESLASELQKFPERFDALRAQHCEYSICEGVTSFYRERIVDAFSREADKLPVHGISAVPVDGPFGYVIARREDEGIHPPHDAPKPVFDFPAGIAVFAQETLEE